MGIRTLLFAGARTVSPRRVAISGNRPRIHLVAAATGRAAGRIARRARIVGAGDLGPRARNRDAAHFESSPLARAAQLRAGCREAIAVLLKGAEKNSRDVSKVCDGDSVRLPLSLLNHDVRRILSSHASLNRHAQRMQVDSRKKMFPFAQQRRRQGQVHFIDVSGHVRY